MENQLIVPEKRFTRLTGAVGNVTGLMRLKRLGKIRLGIKKRHTQSGREYPSATDQDGKPIDYFVIPPELEEKLGPKPKVIRCMFSSNDEEEVYVERLAMYGSSTGLKCSGNGEVARRRDEKGNLIEIKCPCEFLKTDANPKGVCQPEAHLKITIPEVSMWGYFQITTHSIFARAGILSSLKDLKDKTGRIAFVPLRLERVPEDIVHEGKTKTHYIVGFTPELSLPQIIELRTKPELMVLPAPIYRLEEPQIEQGPAADPVDVEMDVSDEEIEAGELADMNDAELDKVQASLKAKRDAMAPKAEPKPEPQTIPFDQSASTWQDILNVCDDDPNLRDMKTRVKEQMKVSNLTKMTAKGQEKFLELMRDLAVKEDRKLPF